MTLYYIRVYNEDDSFNEYDVGTELGDDMSMLIAFLMDGGAKEYEDDGVIELAKMWCEIVSQEKVI